jgi:hypothetical protein
MLKSAMLSGGKDPPGTLELIDIPKSLHPDRVDQILLGDLLGLIRIRNGEGNVAMDRIIDEGHSLIL